MTLYLKLLHGRDDPNQDMEDWGYEGPQLGPFVAVHFTYATHVYCFTNHREDASLELRFHDDMLEHDGKFYGDFEIVDDPDWARGQK